MSVLSHPEKLEITLLSVEEVHKVSPEILICDTPWWLRSEGCGFLNTAYVGTDGTIDEFGAEPSSSFGIRPALKLGEDEVEHLALANVHKIEIAGYTWTVISDIGYALCDSVIGFEPFNYPSGYNYMAISNKYENSNAQEIIQKWAKKNRILISHKGERK